MDIHGTLKAWTLAVLLVPSADARSDEPKVGKQAGELYPDIELPTIDGERTLRLSSLRGKRFVLIEFASW